MDAIAVSSSVIGWTRSLGPRRWMGITQRIGRSYDERAHENRMFVVHKFLHHQKYVRRPFFWVCQDLVLSLTLRNCIHNFGYTLLEICAGYILHNTKGGGQPTGITAVSHVNYIPTRPGGSHAFCLSCLYMKHQ